MYGIPCNPGYLALHRSGELRKRGEALMEILEECTLCPRECRVNRQGGPARPESDGMIHRGLMIRHLVLPGDTRNTVHAMNWVAGNLSADTYVHLMIQYRPAFRAHQYPEINGTVSPDDYMKIVAHARGLGLTNLDVDLPS